MFSGHTAEFEFEDDKFLLKSVPSLGSDTFELKKIQYRFGWDSDEGSEHLVNDKKEAGEVRLNMKGNTVDSRYLELAYLE